MVLRGSRSDALAVASSAASLSAFTDHREPGPDGLLLQQLGWKQPALTSPTAVAYRWSDLKAIFRGGDSPLTSSRSAWRAHAVMHGLRLAHGLILWWHFLRAGENGLPSLIKVA